MPALVASTMNCLLLKTGLFFRLSQKPHQQVPEHLTAWQIFDEITAAKIWQNCKCQGRAEIHLSKYSRFLLQIDSFTAENQIMTSFAYYVMVCIGKGNTLVLKPFFEKSNQNIVAFLQHLFRQNFVTREHNCRKLCPFIYLTAQPWALAPLSINKETTIMSITETWVSCYKAVIRNWSQQIKIITEKQREERNISFQRSKSHKVMFNKERVFLTEQMYWHLRSARSYTAMQYFQEEKKKTRNHQSSFGSHSWGSTEETRNSISCFAPKWGLSNEGFLPFLRGQHLWGGLTFHPCWSLWEQESLRLDMIY